MTIKSKRVEAIIEELKDQYLEEDRYTRPWIIGFSCKDYVRKGSL